jgi:hypothetical protein
MDLSKYKKRYEERLFAFNETRNGKNCEYSSDFQMSGLLDTLIEWERVNYKELEDKIRYFGFSPNELSGLRILRRVLLENVMDTDLTGYGNRKYIVYLKLYQRIQNEIERRKECA